MWWRTQKAHCQNVLTQSSDTKSQKFINLSRLAIKNKWERERERVITFFGDNVIEIESFYDKIKMSRRNEEYWKKKCIIVNAKLFE